MSNQFFHQGKKGTEELEAQEYIIKICSMMELNPDETTYEQL